MLISVHCVMPTFAWFHGQLEIVFSVPNSVACGCNSPIWIEFYDLIVEEKLQIESFGCDLWTGMPVYLWFISVPSTHAEINTHHPGDSPKHKFADVNTESPFKDFYDFIRIILPM